MKRIRSVFTVLLCVIFTCALFELPVYADGTTMIYLSEKDLGVGDTLTMTVNGSSKSTITVRYNASVLNFSNCDAAGYTTNGNAITFTGTSAKITFKAAAEGKSNLIVASDTLTGASTAVNVSGSSAGTSSNDSSSDNSAAPEEPASGDASNTQEETPAGDDANASSGDFTYEGIAYVVSERFNENEMPAGFATQTIEVHGKSYSVPVNDALTLLYLKPEANTNGSGQFFVYDAENDSVSPMQLIGDREHYVIIMPPDSFFMEGLTDAQMSVGENSYHAYQPNGISNDFYFVYGTNESQATGWYQYDVAQGSVQRVNTDLLANASSGVSGSDAADASGDDSSEGESSEHKEPLVDKLIEKFGDVRLILAIMIFALAVLIIIIIYIIVFRKDDDDDVFDDVPERDNDNDINLIASDSDGLLDTDDVGIEEDQTSDVPEAPAPAPVRKASSGPAADDEDDDEEEDEVKAKKPAKKRKLFFTKGREDDIWSEPADEGSSIFDNDDEYEKFFRSVRSKAKDAPDNGQVDVIDLNEL